MVDVRGLDKVPDLADDELVDVQQPDELIDSDIIDNLLLSHVLIVFEGDGILDPINGSCNLADVAAVLCAESWVLCQIVV